VSILRTLRLEAGLTQSQLSQTSGVSYFSVVGYEQGRFGMTLAKALLLSEVLATRLHRETGAVLEQLAHCPHQD
jgi:DNA-binding XRE family transcriptional regulator